MKNLDLIQRLKKTESPEALISAIFSSFPLNRIALSSSLGAEDQVLTHMVLTQFPKARIFVLDTGRLPHETYQVIKQTMDRYSLLYEIYSPNTQDLENMLSQKGPFSFYESLENRKECCEIRKIAPLKRVLSTCDVWITGLRKSQSKYRSDISNVAWDETHHLLKLNPLYDWDEDKVWQYIRDYNIPYNALHDQGYPSIGCAPCSRAVQPGEDSRAGRWWWESEDKKECGLHLVDGKLVRKLEN